MKTFRNDIGAYTHTHTHTHARRTHPDQTSQWVRYAVRRLIHTHTHTNTHGDLAVGAVCRAEAL